MGESWGQQLLSQQQVCQSKSNSVVKPGVRKTGFTLGNCSLGMCKLTVFSIVSLSFG
jgi:hypothetical protein